MKKVYYTLASALLIVLAGVFYFIDPAVSDLFPTCLFHKYTGLLCPGCGSQRAIHAMLHGDIERALYYNSLLVISLPVLGAYWLYRIRRASYKKEQRTGLIPHSLAKVIALAVVVSFWLVRNM